MTLDETIKEAKITAILFENESRKYTMRDSSFYEEQAKAFRKSAREFEQIAEWLEELKAYREVHGAADGIERIEHDALYEPTYNPRRWKYVSEDERIEE